MTPAAGIRLQGILRLDPALREYASSLPLQVFSSATIREERAHVGDNSAASLAGLDLDGVTVSDRVIDGPGANRLPLRIYRGADARDLPVVLYAHGGAFVTGDLDTDHAACVEVARDAECVVVSVGYRLAPEHYCPAALDDVQAAFNDLVANADEYGIDRHRIAVMGRDAGAALMAGLAHRVFDSEGPGILLQILHQPMLDSDVTGSRREFRRTPGLNGPATGAAWTEYLGEAPVGDRTVPAYRPNLEGLAPAFICAAEIDPCRDEAIEYAVRLLQAFVPTELHVVASTFHGFDTAVPDWVISRRTRQMHALALRRTFAVPIADRPAVPNPF